MKIDIRYGKRGYPLELPEDVKVSVVRKKAMPVLADPRQAVAAVFENPVGCRSLSSEAKGCRSACILICDVTRTVPNGLILPPLIETLMGAGIAPESITVLVVMSIF